MDKLQQHQMEENKDRSLFIDKDMPGYARFVDDPMGGVMAGAFTSRIVACVEACIGMADPITEIKALRDKAND